MLRLGIEGKGETTRLVTEVENPDGTRTRVEQPIRFRRRKARPPETEDTGDAPPPEPVPFKR